MPFTACSQGRSFISFLCPRMFLVFAHMVRSLRSSIVIPSLTHRWQYTVRLNQDTLSHYMLMLLCHNWSWFCCLSDVCPLICIYVCLVYFSIALLLSNVPLRKVKKIKIKKETSCILYFFTIKGNLLFQW